MGAKGPTGWACENVLAGLERMPPHSVSPAQPVTMKPERGRVERRVGFSWAQGSSFLPCPLYSAPPFRGGGGVIHWLFQQRPLDSATKQLCDSQ